MYWKCSPPMQVLATHVSWLMNWEWKSKRLIWMKSQPEWSWFEPRTLRGASQCHWRQMGNPAYLSFPCWGRRHDAGDAIKLKYIVLTFYIMFLTHFYPWDRNFLTLSQMIALEWLKVMQKLKLRHTSCGHNGEVATLVRCSYISKLPAYLVAWYIVSKPLTLCFLEARQHTRKQYSIPLCCNSVTVCNSVTHISLT
jgi:hypothetical protein